MHNFPTILNSKDYIYIWITIKMGTVKTVHAWPRNFKTLIRNFEAKNGSLNWNFKENSKTSIQNIRKFLKFSPRFQTYM